MGRLRYLISELRRRKTLRAAGIYIVAAWVAVQVASLIFPAVGIPDSALLYVWLIALFVFPLVLVFAWRYDLSATGLTRTLPARSDEEFDPTLRRTDYVILVLLLVVAVSFAWQLTIRIEPISGLSHIAVNPNSIAVLPFDNLSGDPEQEYFASGMQAALISGLSRIRALRVTSKTSTLRYKKSSETLPQIGRQLSVARIIEGSIYRFKNRVRLEVRLLDAEKDAHIWSATFEDEIEDVLVLQSRAAQAIAGQVRVTLSPDEQAHFDNPGRIDPAAYDALLKGQFHVERFTPEDIAVAAEYFQQAAELAPDHALAYYGLGKLCGFQAQNGDITPEQADEQCLPLDLKALDLDPLLPEAHLLYANNMTWRQFDWDTAGAAFERAIELNPSYAEARMFYSHYLVIVGRVEESIEQMELALELDPLNPFVRGIYGAQLFMVGDFAEAAQVSEEVLASTPGFGFSHEILWYAYHYLGEQDKSIESAANFLRYTQSNPAAADALETVYAGTNYSDALIYTAGILEEHSKNRNVAPSTIAHFYEHAGEYEKAITWFEISHRERDPDTPYIGVLSRTPAMSANPRLQKLLRELKLDHWVGYYSDSMR